MRAIITNEKNASDVTDDSLFHLLGTYVVGDVNNKLSHGQDFFRLDQIHVTRYQKDLVGGYT